MKKLLFVRHGESLANVDENIYWMQPDHSIPLTNKGVDQAVEANSKLKDILKTTTDLAFVHSPWARARVTAQYLAQDIDSVLYEDPIIFEHSVAHSYKEMSQREPYNSEEKEQYSRYWYKTNTSESLSDVYMRARLFVSDLKANRYEEETLIIVSHGVFINMVLGVLHKLSINEILDMPLLNNCQIIAEELK